MMENLREIAKKPTLMSGEKLVREIAQVNGVSYFVAQQIICDWLDHMHESVHKGYVPCYTRKWAKPEELVIAETENNAWVTKRELAR